MRTVLILRPITVAFSYAIPTYMHLSSRDLAAKLTLEDITPIKTSRVANSITGESENKPVGPEIFDVSSCLTLTL